ncbi:MAG: EamA family transporter [Syntrophomonadaceae bacterium]|jgi:drug/metabolite transporter (DMT)-like permease|nr:EamA family transporter [Syntrophomonadaceae bacterium]
MKYWGAICLALAASIWGSMYVVSKYVLDYVPPFTLLWLRYAVAGMVLAVIMLMTRKYKVAGKDILLLAWIGFIGYFISVGTQFVGTKLADAHTGALLTSSSPVFTFLFAWLLLGESITRRKLLALILSMLGMIAVIGINGNESINITGSIILIVAAITWALLSVYVKKASYRYSSLTITTYAIWFALLFTTPVMTWEMQHQAVRLFAAPLVWLGTLYIALVSTALAFFLWNKGMDLLEAGAGSLFLCFQPIVGSILGWLLLDEVLDTAFFIGAAFIISGLIIASLPRRNKDPLP